MIVDYGVYLRKLTIKDLDKVRSWRNQDRIRTQLFDQSIITEEQQIEWFENLQDDSEYYIYGRNEDAGLIFLKNIDYESSTVEAGIFLGEETAEPNVSFRAVLCMNDRAFFQLELDILQCWILNTNETAKRFNFTLGYLPCEENSKATKYRLTVEEYVKNTKWMKKMFQRQR